MWLASLCSMESTDKWFMCLQLSCSSQDNKVDSLFCVGMIETQMESRRAPEWSLKSGEKCSSSLWIPGLGRWCLSPKLAVTLKAHFQGVVCRWRRYLVGKRVCLVFFLTPLNTYWRGDEFLLIWADWQVLRDYIPLHPGETVQYQQTYQPLMGWILNEIHWFRVCLDDRKEIICRVTQLSCTLP